MSRENGELLLTMVINPNYLQALKDNEKYNNTIKYAGVICFHNVIHSHKF
jgi:hypothetical protein